MFSFLQLKKYIYKILNIIIKNFKYLIFFQNLFSIYSINQTALQVPHQNLPSKNHQN